MLPTNWGHLFKHSSLLTGLATNGLYYYSGAPTARGRGTRHHTTSPQDHLTDKPLLKYVLGCERLPTTTPRARHCTPGPWPVLMLRRLLTGALI